MYKSKKFCTKHLSQSWRCDLYMRVQLLQVILLQAINHVQAINTCEQEACMLLGCMCLCIAGMKSMLKKARFDSKDEDNF